MGSSQTVDCQLQRNQKYVVLQDCMVHSEGQCFLKHVESYNIILNLLMCLRGSHVHYMYDIRIYRLSKSN